MRIDVRSAGIAIALGALAAACGGAGGNQRPPQTGGAPIGVQPSSIGFGLQATPPPQIVVLTNVTAGTPISISVQDPTLVGVSTAPPSNGSPAFAIRGIAAGSTTVTFAANGSTATVRTQSALCGRPDALNPAPVQLSPPNGSTSVPQNVGTVYFGVYSVVPRVQPYLHLAVGAHGTLEGGALTAASLPAGIPTAPPQPGRTLTYMSASVPPLQPGTTYRTQPYDDACQPALVAGSFST